MSEGSKRCLLSCTGCYTTESGLLPRWIVTSNYVRRINEGASLRYLQLENIIQMGGMAVVVHSYWPSHLTDLGQTLLLVYALEAKLYLT